VSLRRFKDKVSEVKAESDKDGGGKKGGKGKGGRGGGGGGDGECGLTMGGWSEKMKDLPEDELLKEGDIIECYKNVEVGVKLE